MLSEVSSCDVSELAKLAADIGPHQHSDPGARGNMWPGSQSVRRRTWENRKTCCRCHRTGTVGRPCRGGASVALLLLPLLLHRCPLLFEPKVCQTLGARLTRLTANSADHRGTWCTPAQWSSAFFFCCRESNGGAGQHWPLQAAHYTPWVSMF